MPQVFMSASNCSRDQGSPSLRFARFPIMQLQSKNESCMATVLHYVCFEFCCSMGDGIIEGSCDEARTHDPHVQVASRKRSDDPMNMRRSITSQNTCGYQ